MPPAAGPRADRARSCGRRPTSPKSAVLRCADPGHAGDATSADQMAMVSSSNAIAKTPIRRLLNGQLVVSTSNVLHECMPGDDHSGAGFLLEPSHRSQPRLQPAVICLDAVVGVLVGAVPWPWQQRLWVPVIRSPHATCAYSWISPPSRSRRTTLPAGTRAGGGPDPSGGACPKARCGRWPL
jgi:hypothetical protein